jgi:hypothetical protein
MKFVWLIGVSHLETTLEGSFSLFPLRSSLDQPRSCVSGHMGERQDDSKDERLELARGPKGDLCRHSKVEISTLHQILLPEMHHQTRHGKHMWPMGVGQPILA